MQKVMDSEASLCSAHTELTDKSGKIQFFYELCGAKPPPHKFACP